MMIPLKLCHAFTPWKLQGQTIEKKLVGMLGRLERGNGLMYVIFYQVRRLKDTKYWISYIMEKKLLEVKHLETGLRFSSIYYYVPVGVVLSDTLNNNNNNI